MNQDNSSWKRNGTSPWAILGGKYLIHGVQLDVADRGREESSFWLRRLWTKCPSSGLIILTPCPSACPVPCPPLAPFTPMPLVSQPIRYPSLSQPRKQRCIGYLLYNSQSPNLLEELRARWSSLSQSPQSIFRDDQIISSPFRKEAFLFRSSDVRHLYE